MLVERILADALPGETGAARLQQVGLFTLIFMLQSDDEPVTASRLAAMTGQSVSEVSLQLKKLIKVELIQRNKILNRQRRGYAFHLTIKHTPKSKRLIEAINEAAIQKKKR
ncbi:MAG: hypothetical protein WCE79_00190 [Xanthobacteraceae bacterium]